MKTKWEWNSNVHDIYLNYDKIPSNLEIECDEDIIALLNKTLPAGKHGYLNLYKNIPKYEMRLKEELNFE